MDGPGSRGSLFVSLLLLALAGPAWAQASLDDRLLIPPRALLREAPPGTRPTSAAPISLPEECDPVWDGFLAGILPGIGVSFLYFATAECRMDCGAKLLAWGVAGAGMGGLADQLHCNRESQIQDEKQSGSRRGEVIGAPLGAGIGAVLTNSVTCCAQEGECGAELGPIIFGSIAGAFLGSGVGSAADD